MLLEDTARAIRDAEEQRRRRVADQRRLRRPVSQVDQILAELEEIHLQGGIKVPAAMILRIEHLLDSLPPECRRQFPLRTTITRVMDNLYDIQDRLLTMKDHSRELLRAQDVELDRDVDLDRDVEMDRDDYPAA
jgi:hypothetical protein